MQITLQNTGKRYNRDWIFRRLSYVFEPGRSYAITGSNGSGKSTLLQVIAGAILHSEGSLEYRQHEKKIEPDLAFENISIAAPYLDLVEEMTATEMLGFHRGFKTLVKPITEILEAVSLQNAAHKQIRYYSSGMKQRLKLAQAFFSNTALLLLDEPTTNLDADGVALYRKLIHEHTANRLVIVSSNDKMEYDFCSNVVSIMDYK
ncbi:MAG: ABC transporter ATP-binding protein [Ferruginibacter sp.]